MNYNLSSLKGKREHVTTTDKQSLYGCNETEGLQKRDQISIIFFFF